MSTFTSSFTSWLLFSIGIGAVITLAAVLAHDAQRAALRSVRWVWSGAIVLIVGLSLAAPLRRLPAPQRMPLPDNATIVSNLPTAHAASWTTTWLQVRELVMRPLEAGLQALELWLARIPHGVHVALAWLWLAASLATIAAFCLSYLRVRRLMRHWPVQTVDDVSARIAPATGPAVIGFAPSQIVLPSWLLHRSADERRLVITHESEHVRAGDPWLLLAACAAVAVMPWHPALWFALNRLRLAVELDCDQRVLRRGIPTAAYGLLLIDLSASRAELPSAMPAFSCNGSYLERRLVAMTARRPRFAGSRRVLGGVVALAALVTACESKLPTSAEINAMDVASAQSQASKVALVADGKTAYKVDGQAVSEETAKKIKAERIASVAVTKAGGGSAVQEIRINTKLPLDSAQRAKIELESLAANGGKPVAGMLLRTRSSDSSTAAPIVVERTAERKPFNGLLIVDGVETESSALNKLSPDKIVTVEVVKGEAARTKYSDPRAANGVIVVTTTATKAKP